MWSLSPSASQALDMVAVLVGDEDAGEIFRGAADGGEALADLAEAEARIDQDAGFVGLHVGAIAGGAAAENGQSNRHSLRYGRGKKGQCCTWLRQGVNRPVGEFRTSPTQRATIPRR